jgi:hypothetical protein
MAFDPPEVIGQKTSSLEQEAGFFPADLVIDCPALRGTPGKRTNDSSRVRSPLRFVYVVELPSPLREDRLTPRRHVVFHCFAPIAE